MCILQINQIHFHTSQPSDKQLSNNTGNLHISHPTDI